MESCPSSGGESAEVDTSGKHPAEVNSRGRDAGARTLVRITLPRLALFLFPGLVPENNHAGIPCASVFPGVGNPVAPLLWELTPGSNSSFTLAGAGSAVCVTILPAEWHLARGMFLSLDFITLSACQGSADFAQVSDASFRSDSC